jgi:hypothetical protein
MKNNYYMAGQSVEDSYRFNVLCARATLYPGKSIEEVLDIIEENIKNKNTLIQGKL